MARSILLHKNMIWFYVIVVILFLLYLWHAPKEPFQDVISKKYYTIVPQTYDGFGAQYHAIISGIAYAAQENLVYVHSPLKALGSQHGGNVQELNAFIGIPPGKPPKNIDEMKEEAYSETVHLSENPSEYYTEDVVDKIRKYYYGSKKPNISPPDIAIHIRRGDVTREKNRSEVEGPFGGNRYVENSDYKKIIEMLEKKYPEYNISIFSQGSENDFADLASNKVTFRLNEDLTSTFHSLVTAKVLVTSISSLSYSAAILNENTVYYMSFWHKPLDHWNIL